jgi:glycosyltransferase involved in cell wall biosynthesis
MTATSKPRVLYWNNIPSPYIVERFNVIARRANVDLHVCFNQRLQPDRSWDVDESRWVFPYSYLPRSRLTGLQVPLPQLRRLQPDLLITLYENLSFVSGVLLAKQRGLKVALHAMKVFDTWRPIRWHRELAKRWLFPRVDAFHVPGADAAAYVSHYGARPGRIWAFPEPVDVQHFAFGACQARQDSEARRRLGLTGCVYLHVGRLWSGKGIDYLLDAYARLRAEGVPASLVLVGDGADEARYRARAAGLPNVVFPGFVQKPDLPRWHGLADVLVFPTLGDPYGHVVQEAMAAGLPVIATENAGEIRERVLDGETGFVVPAADSDALLDRMRGLALDPERRRRMGERGYEWIRPRTNEWWAGEFETMVQCIVGGGMMAGLRTAA